MTRPDDTDGYTQIKMTKLITSAVDVADIIVQMRHHLADNPTAWTNHTLDAYLHGLAETLRGMDTTLRDDPRLDPDQPSWFWIAQAIVLASGHE